MNGTGVLAIAANQDQNANKIILFAQVKTKHTIKTVDVKQLERDSKAQ